MTNADLQQILKSEAAETDAHEALVRTVAMTNQPFWVGIACKALGLARNFFKLNAEESAAFDVVIGILCGGA